MKLKYILLFLLFAFLIFGSFQYATRDKPIEVTARQADIGLVEATVANTRAGTVKARHRARLAPAIGGRIATLDVKKGDKVKKEQVLLTLWNDDIRSQLKLARREAEVAETLVKESCLLADLAQRNANRSTELHRKQSTSELAHDEALTNAAVKTSVCKRSALQAQASKLRIETIQAQLEKTILRAPFGGIVAEVNGEIGEFITPSPTGVATLPAIDLISLDDIYVTAPIDEMDAAQIFVGMESRISLDAFVDKQFSGKVLRIAPYVLEQAKQARTVEVECGFIKSEKTANLLAGYSADVEIILDVRDDVLRIPTESLLEDGSVYVLDRQNNLVEKRPVKTGLANWRYTEVLTGLDEGEWLVTSLGREGLKDGAAAVIAKDDTKEK